MFDVTRGVEPSSGIACLQCVETWHLIPAECCRNVHVSVNIFAGNKQVEGLFLEHPHDS